MSFAAISAMPAEFAPYATIPLGALNKLSARRDRIHAQAAQTA